VESWNRGILTDLELRTPAGRRLYILLFLLLGLTALTVIFPFVFAFTSGLKNSTEIYKGGLQLLPNNPQWSNYYDVWQRFDFNRMFLNSIIVVIGGLAFQLTITTLAAYSLAQLQPIGGRLVFYGFLLTLMIPSIAYIVPLYTTIVDVPILHVSLSNNYLGLWLPYSVNAFGIFIMKAFFESIPSELFEAAKVDGASAFRIFRSIALPLSRSILVVLVIVGFLALWRDYLLPFLVIQDPNMQPITVRLYTMLTLRQIPSPLNIQMAASFLGLMPPLFIAILLQRHLQRGLSAGAVKG
jgi:multiple sugar transport system permease protein